jgi:predicted phage terminase large subunit-like protein
MPVFIKSDDNEEHYLIDWYYKKVAMTDAYDDVIDMIRQHKITHFHIENNTDTSLVSIIEMKLKEKGYTNCDVTEIFNTVKKEVRIKDARGMIKKKLFFKPKGSYTPNSMIGKAMEALTTYSFDYANKNDDAPDSLALYVNKFILEDLEKVTVTPIDRSSLNF